MKTIVFALLGLLAIAALATPLAAAGGPDVPADGFGRCVITEQSVGYYYDPVTGEYQDLSIPDYECYW